MQAPTRIEGREPAVGSFVDAHGEHVVAFYGNDEELTANVAEYFSRGIRSDDVVVFIATPEHRAAVEHHLGDLVAYAGERYVALDAAETLAAFMVDGSPNAARFRDVVGGVVSSALSRGGRGRAFGEMVALLWADGNGDAAIELEDLWNDLATVLRFDLLCAYPLASFSADDGLDMATRVCSVHSAVTEPESYATARFEIPPDVDDITHIFVPAN